MKKSYEIDMLHGALLPKILLFAIPLAISSILQLLFNAADVIVLGRFVSAEALAAVGSTSSFVNLVVNFFIGISVGVNVLVAQFYARHDEDMVQDVVHTAIGTSIIAGFIFIFVGIALSEPLMILMGSPDEVRYMSVLYLRIYFIGLPFILLYNFGAAILRAIGDTKRPLYYLIFAGIVNVCLNLYFVLEWNMGVAGVAIATSVSNFISSILVLRTLLKEKGALKVELNRIKIDRKVLFRICKIGLPAGLQSCFFSISNMVIQSSINSFGAIAMAGSTAASNIEGFVYNAMNAVYQADLSFTSQNVGAGMYSRINRILGTCILATTLIGLPLGLLACLFGTQLISIYNTDPEVISSGLERLYIICATYFLCGYGDVLVGSLRGMGESFIPMIVTLTGVCGLRILWILTVLNIFPTLGVLYMCYPVSWAVTAAIQLSYFFKIRRKLPREDAVSA